MPQHGRASQQLHDADFILGPAAIGAGTVPLQCRTMGRSGGRVLFGVDSRRPVLCVVHYLAWVVGPLLVLQSWAYLARIRPREYFGPG